MRPAFVSLLALLVCARMACAAEADTPPKDLAELRQRIEGILDKTQTPAIGIALVNRDGPYWVAGLGKADLKSGRQADADTVFRIGSISKMFVALAVLKLTDEGRLSLNDTVHDRAPEIAFENPWEQTNPVRIVHLLEHTTGWDDIHLAEYARAAPDTMSIREGLDYHPDSRISRWVPGTRHAYCNVGSAVAAYIVEKVTGRRFEDYVAETLFAPLGMASTSYFRTPAYEDRGATLYLGDRPQAYWEIIYRPAGSINSSANDMAKFVHLLLLRGATPGARILPGQSIDRMETPATTLGVAAGVTGGYGLANYAGGYKNYNVAFHGHNGAVVGGMSELAYVKERGEGYVFMINSSNGAAASQLSELIRSYLLRDVHPAEQATAALPAAFGEIDGYYAAINPRQQSMRFLTEIMSVHRISHDEHFLHRKPLFASWISNDRPANDRALIDAWHGLPAIAVVADPLAGPAIQVNSETYKRVPAWRVFAPFVVVILMILMSLGGLLALLVWCLGRFVTRRSADHRLWMRLLPLIATFLLFSFLIALGSAGMFLQQAGTISALSIGILLLSLSYPAVVLLGAFHLLGQRTREHRNLPYWFAALFLLVHAVIASYLAAYDVIGIRTWA